MTFRGRQPFPDHAEAGVARRHILKILRENRGEAWCAKMLAGFTLPASVHDEAHCLMWQRRFYDMNVRSEKKKLEKLDYMHHNPAQRGLVGHVGGGPCSSWRYYYREDESVVAMDRMP